MRRKPTAQKKKKKKKKKKHKIVTCENVRVHVQCIQHPIHIKFSFTRIMQVVAHKLVTSLVTSMLPIQTHNDATTQTHASYEPVSCSSTQTHTGYEPVSCSSSAIITQTHTGYEPVSCSSSAHKRTLVTNR